MKECEIYYSVSFIHVTQPFRLVGQEPEPSQAIDTALACCFLGKVLGVGWHYFPSPLVNPTFAARYLHTCTTREILAAKGGTVGRGMADKFRPKAATSGDLSHAANLRHGTESFTSPPKEGVLRIFKPWKIRRLRPGSNPRTWVPKTSTLPLDHRIVYYI